MAGSEFSVCLGDSVVGRLSPDVADPFGLRFHYDENWIAKGGQLLSPAVGRKTEESSSAATAFFENMLPEGAAFERLVQYARVSRRNVLGLLLAMQNDLPGAVRIAGDSSEDRTDTFRPISDDAILERLEKPLTHPMDVWDGRPRLSVAGMQTKLNVLKLDGVYGLADGHNLCSDRILKFEVPESHLVVNEYLTMQLAQNIGLPVAQTKLIDIAGHRVLEVLRFDRRLEKTNDVVRVRRRHVIDGCQALGLFSSMKYERNFGDGRDVAHIRDGVSFRKLFGLKKHVAKAKQEAFCLRILDWMLFNLIVGNSDAHGKNISFAVTQKGLEVAPWYDLVSVGMVENVSHSFAMSVGDEFAADDVHALQLLWEMEEVGITREKLQERLDMMLEMMDLSLKPTVERSGLPKQEKAFGKKWCKSIQGNLKRWKVEAKVLPKLSI